MRRRYPQMPGRLRHAVAELLEAHIGHYVDPTGVKPALGSWRSCPYHDVYRWEVNLPREEGDKFGYPLGCWMTMTKFVPLAKKHGIEIDWAGNEIKIAWPKGKGKS